MGTRSERKIRSEQQEIWKGALAGLVAGLAGTLAMTGFQQAWSKVTGTLKHELEHERMHSPERGTGDQPQSDDATMKAANRLAQAVLHRELSQEEKRKAGPIVHYSFGALTGALYGGLAEISPIFSAGQGTAFSSALWLLGDEIAVPSLGLSGPPWDSPLSSHAYAWASHLVYGFTTEWTRRGTRHLLGNKQPLRDDTGTKLELGETTRPRRHTARQQQRAA